MKTTTRMIAMLALTVAGAAGCHHKHEPKESFFASEGVVKRPVARTGTTRSITNQYRQKGARRRPPDGKDLAVRGGGSTLAGAGIAEVSSFGLTGSSSRPPLARQSFERPGHPWMNLLLNLKRLHLSKSNKLASLVRRLLATGSVDEFSRRTRARQPSLTAADLSKFDAHSSGSTIAAEIANRKLRQV